MIERDEDAFGRLMYDFHCGKEVGEVVERDDGYVDVFGGSAIYFADFADWSPFERRAMRYVRGRVLDLGCGAGRACLHLQKQGLDVVGIDTSPLAIKVCRLRGVKKAGVLSLTQLGPALLPRLGGRFDTLLMMANNFGLFGSFRRARWLLRRFRGITGPGARIIAATVDPYASGAPEHRAYHAWNRRRGRMGGQVRIRVRYRLHVTPWFDYLLVSKGEMRRILAGTGWRLARTIDDPATHGYMAIIERED